MGGRGVTIRLKWVDHFTDRHGHMRYYFRRPGEKRIPLPHIDAPGFMAAYNAAEAGGGAKVERSKAVPKSIRALAELYYGSTAFLSLKESTQAVNRGLIDALCAKHGHRPVATMERKHVEAIIREKVKTPSGANNTLKKLRMLMGFAIAHGWRETDPTAKIKKFKEGTHHTWTDDEINAFEAHWPIGTRERLAFALHLYTGQRRGDVAAMTWSAFDRRSSTIEVKQEKTGEPLVIPAHMKLRTILDKSPRQCVTILATSHGRPWVVESYGNFMADSIAAAGLGDRCVLHGLRKAAARRLAEAGCSSREIGSITGHRTLSEIDRYTKAVDQKALAKAAVVRLEEHTGDRQSQPRPNGLGKGAKR